jgi:hypothetical protein
MGTKQVTGTSETDHAHAFEDVLNEHPPTTNSPRSYTVIGWRAQAGGVVGKPIYYVDVEVSGDDVGDE